MHIHLMSLENFCLVPSLLLNIGCSVLTILYSERPKLCTTLVFLSAIWLIHTKPLMVKFGVFRIDDFIFFHKNIIVK